MSFDGRTAFINFTLVMSSLAFLTVIAIGYLSGASYSSLVLKGFVALLSVGGLGWLVLKLLAAYPQGDAPSLQGEMEGSDGQ